MRVVDDGDDRTEVGVNIRQPLLKGLSREYQLSNVKSAEFGLRSANRSLYLTQVDLILQTVATVYEIIRQREFVRLNEESAGRLRGFVQATQAKERAGLASAIDVYRATLELNEAEDNLITAREDYQDVLDRLKLLLDVPITEELDVEAPLAYSIYAVDEQIAVLLALENRVELEQMSDTVEEARRRVRNAKHGLLPDFDLILDYVRFGQDENVANSAEFDRYSWTVGVASTSDVFRTSERVAYRQTQLGLIAAQRSQDVLEDDIVRQVKQRIRTLQRSQERIDLQSDGVKQAEGQMELALTKFQQGLASNFDLIEAESELRRAELDLISAVIDYIVGTYRLRAELGTLLEEPETW
jgi:outer membrane protein TolC